MGILGLGFFLCFLVLRGLEVLLCGGGVGFVVVFLFKAVAVPLSRAARVVAEGENKKGRRRLQTLIFVGAVSTFCALPRCQGFPFPLLRGSPSDAGLGQPPALKAP